MSKVVLITGCSSGFGLVTAKYLAEKGYTVIPTVRKKTDLAKLPNTVLLDVTWSQPKINRFIYSVIKKYGRIDVLINNAGSGVIGRLEDVSEAEAKKQFETNFFGVHKMTKAVLPDMKRRNEGLIVNISSILGLISIPDYGIYSASKHALESLSQTLRLEIKKSGIKIVVVNPGAFKTKFYTNSTSVSKEKYDPEGYGLDPIQVSKLLAKIIETRNPRSNYIIGKEALMIKTVLTLPSFIREFVLRVNFS